MQKGDTVTVTAPGYYPQAVQSASFAFSLAGFVAGLLQQQPAPAPGTDGSRRGALPLLSIGVSAALPALIKPSGGVPQGYVRLLGFDADSNLVSQQVQTRQLSAAAASGYEPLTVQVVAAQDGYVTAYVGNESNADVYFDDVSVTLGQGLQVQETEYDPAGLELAGLAPPSPGIRGLNQYRFNGKEFQADLGLNWNHQDWRFFNPQIFTWSVVDPEVENGQESLSPYAFGYDNAVRYNDPNGRCPCEGDVTLGSVGQLLYNTAAGVVVSAINTVMLAGEGSTGLPGIQNRAWLGENGNISFGMRTPATSAQEALGNLGSDLLDVANTAVAALTVGEGSVAVRALPRAAGMLFAKTAGKEVVANELVQEGKQFATGTYGQLTRAGLNDAHHNIQNAAVKDLPGYSRSAAPSIQLPGRSVGTPHHAANQVQGARRRLGDGGTYGAERRVGYRAMRAAGVPRTEAKQAIRQSDDYFSTIGVNLQTPTNIPKR